MRPSAGSCWEPGIVAMHGVHQTRFVVDFPASRKHVRGRRLQKLNIANIEERQDFMITSGKRPRSTQACGEKGLPLDLSVSPISSPECKASAVS